MCVYSMVTDHFRDMWTPGWKPGEPYPTLVPSPFPPTTIGPWTTPWSAPDEPKTVEITLEEYEEYRRLKRNAEELDAVTGQPDCVKPEVAEWEAVIEAYLRKHGLLRD